MSIYRKEISRIVNAEFQVCRYFGGIRVPSTVAISDRVISRLYAATILEIVGTVRRVGGSATILLLNTLLRVSLP